MHWLVYVVFLVVVFGCSWFSKSTEDIIDLPPPRIIQSVVPKTPAKRQPGSLWSEDSKWNELYSVASTRQPGDIITVKVTDSLKARIAQLVAAKTGKPVADVRNGGEPLPKNEPKPAERTPAAEKGGSKAGQPDAKAAEKTPDSKGKSNIDTKTFEATILEILPNGVYRIASNQGLKVGGPNEPYVSLEGNLREKEVSADDTVSSDVLLGTKLDLVDMNSPNVIPVK